MQKPLKAMSRFVSNVAKATSSKKVASACTVGLHQPKIPKSLNK
ncbi:MAG: cyclic lactone autoinducer peptide [Clostridia bacterium]|nr:cyclic lactone autoinducer peptide [Clostridia bacterium]